MDSNFKKINHLSASRREIAVADQADAEFGEHAAAPPG